jgi:hypothetical protein
MAVFYRPYLFELIMMFVNKEIDMELGIITKGTRDYAKPIIDDILMKLKEKYQLSEKQLSGIFEIRLYREDLNSDYKDLNIIADRYNINVDNILLADDLISNFTH